MKIGLKKPQATFDPASHTYALADGTPLQGITGMLSKQLFPDKYKGVDEGTLRRAAERGSFIHEACELMDELGITPGSPETASYGKIKEAHGLRHEASEYLVTDGRRFASCIDKVYRESDAAFTLADIKTTFKLDREYVRWQLSVYAFLFELQNPGATVARLAAIWLRGEQSAFEEVERIPGGTVAALLEAEAEGRQFTPPSCPLTLPEKYRQMERSIIETERMAKEWAAKRKELMDGIMREMVLAGAYQWEGDSIKLTRKKDGIRKSFDPKRLEKDHPDIYSAYLTETPVAGSVTLKIKQKS